MNAFDSQLASWLHNVVDDELASAPPTQLMMTRGRRARRRKALVVTAASFAVLVVGGVGVVATGGGESPASSRPNAVAAAPELDLVAAIKASENISYKVRVTQGGKENPTGWGTTEGAFDPATGTGYLNSSSPGAGVVYYERLIDGVRFVSSSGSKDKWKQYPGKHDRLAYDSSLDGAVSASADPDQLFEALRQTGAVITRTGADTYHFKVSLKASTAAIKGDTLAGDVVLGADKRIAKVAYERTRQVSKGGQTHTDTSVATVQLSDYGTPVQVKRPTDVVVVD
ncbi:hypothetical protein [Micromonospora sp. NBC_00858]|uniref:hypothetical protein n=1 Tax=Micromonospora sp. NBC_00858 TaxID=2975979 RepID=UPI00386B2BDA|nr:DUF2694 domain-containing protein [Micromonospora sp. NBC_00858]